jgi:Ca2+-binding EF-hand superfamily protein
MGRLSKKPAVNAIKEDADTLFERLDSDHTGTIPTDFVEQIPAVLDIALDVDQAKSQLDPHGNGIIDEETFVLWYCGNGEAAKLLAKKTRGIELLAVAQDMADTMNVPGSDDLPTEALQKLHAYGYKPDAIKKLQKDIPGGTINFIAVKDLGDWLASGSRAADDLLAAWAKGEVVEEGASKKKQKKPQGKTATERRIYKCWTDMDDDGNGKLDKFELISKLPQATGARLSELEVQEACDELKVAKKDLEFETFNVWLVSGTIVSAKVKKSLFASLGENQEKTSRLKGMKSDLKRVRRFVPHPKKITQALGPKGKQPDAVYLFEEEAKLAFASMEYVGQDGAAKGFITREGMASLVDALGVDLSEQEVEEVIDEICPAEGLDETSPRSRPGSPDRPRPGSPVRPRPGSPVGGDEDDGDAEVVEVGSAPVEEPTSGLTYDTFIGWLKSGRSQQVEIINESFETYLEVMQGDNVTVYGSICDGAGWDTVRASKQVLSGKWYYEVVLGDKCSGRIGFARSDFGLVSNTDGLGSAGALGEGWAFDGHKQLKHDTSSDESTSSYPCTTWKTGDVVGCTLDLDVGEISFSLNGNDLGQAFKGIEPGDGIFPCTTLRSGPHTFVFSAENLQYRPPTCRPFSLAVDYKGFDIESMAIASVRQVAMQHGPAWERPGKSVIKGFDDEGVHLLVGQTIDYIGQGVGDVVDYDQKMSSRGHTVKWEVGPATKLKLEKQNLFMVLNQDYVNKYLDRNIDKALTDYKRADADRLELVDVMKEVCRIRIERKIVRESKGIELDDTLKLVDSDIAQMFGELDTEGVSEVVVTPKAVFALFELMHEPLASEYEDDILREMETTNMLPSDWDGALTLLGFSVWLKSPEKVATKLMHAAIHLKEQELQRALFGQLDDDSSGMIEAEEVAILGLVTHVELDHDETDAAFVEMDLDSSGSVSFPEFQLWMESDSAIAKKIRQQAVSGSEMAGRESLVTMKVIGATPDSAMVCKGKVFDKADYETVRACKGVSGGKWYYEVYLGDGSNCQFGFARSDFESSMRNEGEELSTGQSWRFNGLTHQKFNHGAQDYPPLAEQTGGLEKPWIPGDTVGCLLNLDAGEISFQVEGRDLGIAFQGVRSSTKLKIYPCATLQDGPHLFKFASAELKHYDDIPPGYRLFTGAADDGIDDSEVLEKAVTRREAEQAARREAMQRGDAWQDGRSIVRTFDKRELVGYRIDHPEHGQGLVLDRAKGKKGKHTIKLDSTGENVEVKLGKKSSYKVQSEEYVATYALQALLDMDKDEIEAMRRVEQTAIAKM